ncbi:ATP-binding protein [Desulfitibacter alkalitolerans]|uniref:DNA polymerase III subunit n=1 Tax=Desulfitibacter alkalitolerans TaxID=264641 RepID=UPI0006858DE2|nr:DNA polymerase III subunit delta' C-terminal domain-containing protein [Desulfitibacter alkalitolerans]
MYSNPMSLLKQKAAKDQVVHAYLFLGSNDLRKNAAQLAMILNCLDLKADGNACGVCTSCYKITTGSHPDIYILRPDGSSMKIHQIREMQKHLAYKIYEGKYKVIILEEADKLTLQGANSLLKILEEPMPQTIFILLAASQREIPDTIISRCQRIYFGEEVDQHDYPETIKILEDVFSEDFARTLSLIEKLEKEDKEHLKQRINGLMVLIRDLVVLKSTKEEKLINISQLSNSSLEKIAVNHEKLVKILEKLYKSLKDLDRNANKRLLLESLFLTMKRISQ